MRKLIYSMGVSLDGFIAGPEGEIDWTAPDEELMRFHNEQTRELGAHLCGRGLYEDMLPWETEEKRRELEFALDLEGDPEGGLLHHARQGARQRDPGRWRRRRRGRPAQGRSPERTSPSAAPGSRPR